MSRRIALALALAAALTLVACGGGGIALPDDLLGAGPTPPPTSPTEPPASPPTAPPTEPPVGTSMTEGELAKALEVLERVNAERALVGQPPLVWDDLAAETAYQHSTDMDVRDYFAHTNPDGLGPGGRLEANGVEFRGAGENIYWASWSASAADAMDGWMNSSGHRDNLLRAGWTHTGIGVRDQGGGSWWTQVFLSR